MFRSHRLIDHHPSAPPLLFLPLRLEFEWENLKQFKKGDSGLARASEFP
jgi:hypothetical protein